MTGFSAVGRSILATIGVALLGCIERPATTSSSHYETPATVGEPSIILLAAGDIADCNSLNGAVATARILGGIDGTIAALGDLAYPKGTAPQFRDCYDKTWGHYKNRTRPTPGNHEYYTLGAGPYFAYFGLAAGDPEKGFYSYDLGTWHILVLNSNCEKIDGGCKADSPQERWLKDDLAAHRAACTLAYWHHPLFSSGRDPVHAQSLSS